MFVVSAKEAVFYPAFSVILSVCLLATSHKTTHQILKKLQPQMYHWTRKSPLNFGSHPDLDPDLGIFGIFTTVG